MLAMALLDKLGSPQTCLAIHVYIHVFATSFCIVLAVPLYVKVVKRASKPLEAFGRRVRLQAATALLPLLRDPGRPRRTIG
jgi:hypothetical protein